MKTYLLTTFVAALLLIPALAGAATTGPSAGQTQSNIEVANSSPPPVPYGSSVSLPAPGYQSNIPVSATIPGSPASNAALHDSTMWLVNQTGGGR